MKRFEVCNNPKFIFNMKICFKCLRINIFYGSCMEDGNVRGDNSEPIQVPEFYFVLFSSSEFPYEAEKNRLIKNVLKFSFQIAVTKFC